MCGSIPSVTAKSIVRLMIVSGTITNDVGAMLRSTDGSGEDHGGGEGPKGRRELVPWLGSVPASVLEALPALVNLNWYSVI